MSTAVPFFLVDVFADRPLTGNPLAVVADADSPDDTPVRYEGPALFDEARVPIDGYYT